MLKTMTPAKHANQSWAQALLRPRSIALVGVSDDVGKTAGRPLRFLRNANFEHAVFPVNPTRDTVQGEKSYASVSQLPQVPDHVFILTGAERALDTLEDCGRLGVPVATLLAGGFSEAGEKGMENDRRLQDITARYPMRVLGPSSIGIANLHHNLVLTANAAFAETDLPRGGIFVGSHSGSLIGALASKGKTRGVGFAGLVSVGGESDLSIGEICSATLDDPNVTSYLLFLETLNHADHLRDFAIEAALRGKPVAAYKLGRTAQAAELTVSHTGALAGSDEVADTFLRECGIARISSFDGLLEISTLLEKIRPQVRSRPATVGVVTTTGGGAAMAVDQIALGGVDIAEPSEATRKRLADVGIDVPHGTIVDLTLAGTRYEVMKAALDVLLEAPEFDLVLATVGSSARFNPELAVRPIIDVSRVHEKPLAAYIVPEAPDAVRALVAAGVPAFATPEICGECISAAFNRKPPRIAASTPATPVQSADRVLSEADAYAMMAAAGIVHAPFLILEPGQPFCELGFGYPVVAKVLHEQIAHKSDLGGVVVSIPDKAALAIAMEQIKKAVEGHRRDLAVDRILVQPMMRGVGEMLIGIRRDPQVGPLVVLAAGGVFAELYRDTSMRIAPVDHPTALAMIDEVRASQLLKGYRGGVKGDIDALAHAIAAFSDLAISSTPTILEAEINPIIVLPDGEGVVAVDGLFRIGLEHAQ